jgi:mycothiol synthase
LTDGLHARSPRPADLPAIAALLRECERADAGVVLRSEAHVAAHTHADRFELSRDALLIDDRRGAPVAFAWVFETLPHAELEAELYVRPDARARGLEAALLDWLEGSARARLPSALETGLSLAIDCPADDRTLRELYEGAGFARLREYRHMEADLTGLPATRARTPLPDGVVLRDFRSPADERPVYETLTDAFADEYRYGEESYEAWRACSVERDDTDTALWVVAAHDCRVIGALVSFIEEGAGHISDLGVSRAWRRRGLGSALLREAFRRLRRRGCARAWLNVDADNPTGAVATYESVGMHAVHSVDLFEKRYQRGKATDRESA